MVRSITSRKLDFPSLRHEKRRLESQRNQQNPEFWIQYGCPVFCVVLTLLCNMYTYCYVAFMHKLPRNVLQSAKITNNNNDKSISFNDLQLECF